MKIISIRQGFQGDHSSTSYEFYAVDKPLNSTQRAAVGRLSSRAMPTKHRVSFIYHGEWSDLPGGWEPLVEKYYDVMYSESYDWWTLAMAFNAEQDKIKEIQQYGFDGVEDMGIRVYSKGKRVIIAINCRLDPGILMDDEQSSYEYDDWYDDDEDAEDEDNDWDNDDEDENNDERTENAGDSLLNLLAQNREYIKNGDYRLLYGIWQIYGYSPDDEEEFEEETPMPLEPPGMDKLPAPLQNLLNNFEEGEY